MLLGNTRSYNRNSTSNNQSANRSKSSLRSNNLNRQITPLKVKKELYKIQPILNNTLNNSKQSEKIKYKSKDALLIMQSLQDIYHHLSFNQYDAFPIDNIQQAKNKINDLYQYYKGQPICPKHSDLLNLYCQSDKEVICVSCVYKAMGDHKGHKIKSIENVEKTLDYESIRNDQKCKALVHQLFEIKQQIQKMDHEVHDQYTIISNYTSKIFEQSKQELDIMRAEMQKKLNIAYRRTTTVISRYRQALEQMISMIDSNIQKSISSGKLSKYLLLKSILNESFLIDDLILKFNENKVLIEQWKKSTRDFQKMLVKKKFQPSTKVDSYLVTEF